MPDFFMLSNPANPYSTRLSDDSPIYNTHLICRRAKILKKLNQGYGKKYQVHRLSKIGAYD